MQCDIVLGCDGFHGVSRATRPHLPCRGRGPHRYAGGRQGHLALQDTDELVAGLLDHFHRHDDGRLDAYSATRLASVWRAVDFSHWFLENLLLARPAEGRFREGLRETRLARLMEGKAFARHFAGNYVGLPETDSSAR